MTKRRGDPCIRIVLKYGACGGGGSGGPVTHHSVGTKRSPQPESAAASRVSVLALCMLRVQMPSVEDLPLSLL